jgi:hypothetical protein
VILRSDNHISFLKKHGKDPADYRPDILHQVSSFDDSVINRGCLVLVDVAGQSTEQGRSSADLLSYASERTGRGLAAVPYSANV